MAMCTQLDVGAPAPN